jgi:hypothetical protein
LAKTLRVRTRSGWTTKPSADLEINKLTAEEVDDNFLELEDDITQTAFDSTSDILDDTSEGFGVGSIWATSSGSVYREVASSTPGRYLITAGGVKLDKVITGEAGFSPVRNPVFSPLVDGVNVIASRLRDGALYGQASGTLYRSLDEGISWTAAAAVGPVVLLVPAGDGEVLAACSGSGIRKSSGWGSNPLTATWSTVLVSADSDFLSWGLDTDSQGTCVATHYRSTDYTKSRYIWLSENSGNTWDIIFDLDDYHSAESSPGHHHLHCVALDPWADNRIWASWHGLPSEGGTGGKAIMYSDNNGVDWHIVSDEWQPTTAVATPFGMVFGTDDGPGGILHCERTEDPDDMTVYLATPFPVEQTFAAWVFAVYSEYDERDGIAYISFISQVDDTPAGIFASDGRHASELYRTEPQDSGDGFREFAILEDSILWRTRIKDSGGTPTVYTTRTHKARRGPSNPSEFDTGRILGGIISFNGSTPFRSTAIGVLAHAGPSTDSIAIGYKSRAGHANDGSPRAIAIGVGASAPNAGSIAIGYQASGPFGSLAIGDNAVCGTNDVAMGRNTITGGTAVACGWGALARTGSVAIGRSAAHKAAGSADYVTIGRDSKAGSNGIAIGRDSDADVRAVVVGRSAAAVTDAMAFGFEANAGHTNSITFGGATTVQNQFRFGANRHLTISARTAAPGNPAAGEAAVYLFDNSGTMELRVRFSNGVEKVIADWS